MKVKNTEHIRIRFHKAETVYHANTDTTRVFNVWEVKYRVDIGRMTEQYNMELQNEVAQWTFRNKGQATVTPDTDTVHDWITANSREREANHKPRNVIITSTTDDIQLKRMVFPKTGTEFMDDATIRLFQLMDDTAKTGEATNKKYGRSTGGEEDLPAG